MVASLHAVEVELDHQGRTTRQPDSQLVFELEDAEGTSVYRRAVRTVSGYHSNSISSRMCRVWEVERVSESNVLSFDILKDACLDEDAPAERQLQRSHHTEVEDRKATFGSNNSKHQLTQGNASQTIPCSRDSIPKRLHRVLYAEPRVTLGSMSTLGEVLDVLLQTLKALQLLYAAGWVHRDISFGSIVAHATSGGNVDSRGWRANLCDMENAKLYTLNAEEAYKDPKTGTLYFTPNEILSGEALLPPQDSPTQELQKPLTSDDYIALFKAVMHKAQEQSRGFANSPPPPAVLVTPNFQHDLESIWWLTVYTVTARVEHVRSNDFAQDFFEPCSSMTGPGLGGFFRTSFLARPPSTHTSLVHWLHPDISSIAEVLEMMRGELVRHYEVRNEKRRSGDVTGDLESYADIHWTFYGIFKAMVRFYQDRLSRVLSCPLMVEVPQSAGNDDGKSLEVRVIE